MTDRNANDYSIELAWKWTTPPGVKRMGVFIMICTIPKMDEESNVRDCVHLLMFKPGFN